jgi:hypothetical protein
MVPVLAARADGALVSDAAAAASPETRRGALGDGRKRLGMPSASGRSRPAVPGPGISAPAAFVAAYLHHPRLSFTTV